jgi:hypothetical protein
MAAVAECDEIRGFIPSSRCTWDQVMDVEIACLFVRSAVSAAVFITREHGCSSPRPCIAIRSVDAHVLKASIGLRSRVLNLSSKRLPSVIACRYSGSGGTLVAGAV